MTFTTSQRFAVFITVFKDFAVTTRDVADLHFAGDLKMAYACLTSMSDLVGGEINDNGVSGRGITNKTRPGKPVVWQAHRTYDEISFEQAMDAFNAA